MALKISELSKTYPNGVQALTDVSLEVGQGMFGLLGPNGAGKSTLMRILATIQEADSGEVSLDGIDVLNQKHEIRKRLGYLPQEFGFYQRERASRLLEHFAELKGYSRKSQRKDQVDYLLHKVNLWNARDKKIGSFSGGMRQRLGIAQAMIGKPKLIVVDEPTAGLDPEERNRFHNLLSEIGEEIVVILSTHIVDDVSDLCTRMAVINNGKILAEGNPLEMIAGLKGKVWRREAEKTEVEQLRTQTEVLTTRLFAGKTFVDAYSIEKPGSDFSSLSPALEHVYFKILSDSRSSSANPDV